MNNKNLQVTKSKYIWRILIGLSILFLFLESMVERHGYFAEHSIDAFFGFYSLFGFLACFIGIIITKALSFLLNVEETYYD